MKEVPASTAIEKNAAATDTNGPMSGASTAGDSAAGTPQSGNSGTGSSGITSAVSSRSGSGTSGLSGSQWITSSSRVHLSRSRQTWTGAGSAAGYVLRYLTPMRRLMMDVTGNEKAADRSLAILVAHLVKAGFSGHDQGRLRDFLVRGIRSAAKAGYDESVAEHRKNESLDLADAANGSATPKPPELDVAQLQSQTWITYWREGILQRSWRALERYQHARRYDRIGSASSTDGEKPPEDLIHDVLRVAMSYPNETTDQRTARVATMAGRSVTQDEVNTQLEFARVRFAQLIADEVAQTLDTPDPLAIQSEIKMLGLGKAFVGIKVEAWGTTKQ